MFDSDLGREEGAVMSGRRVFLLSSVSGLAGIILWSLRKPGFVAQIRQATNHSKI